MKKLLLLSLTILLFSCGGSDSDDNPNQTFRDIYSNTFWGNGGSILTFSNDKIFSASAVGLNDCYFTKEGSYNNVETVGCSFENVTISIIEETADRLVYTVAVSYDSPNDFYCGSDVVTNTFQALGENSILKSSSFINYPEWNESYTLERLDDISSFVNCQDNTLLGRIF